MSANVDQIFITKFEREVAHEFQQKESLLRQNVRTLTGVSKDIKIPRMEAVSATRNKARHADLNPAGVDNDFVTLNFVNIHASELIDDLDSIKTNVDLRRSYTETLTAAVNREIDALIIEALDECANTELSISNAMNAAGLIKAGEVLTLANVPFEDRIAVISPGAMTDILSDNKLVSKDYVSNELLNKGFVKGVLGFSLVTHTGLPAGTGASQTRCFFYPKNAVVLGINKDLTMKADWIAHKDAWQIMVKASVGAKIVRTEAVQRASIAD